MIRVRRDDVSLRFVYLELSRHEKSIENYALSTRRFIDFCGYEKI